jgi:phage-related minor tail protein
MFTNSVVSSPTLFKFAQGTGLMGEAGPEAIMPLKRDSNGNLGVRAGGNGGNVDVVVNNFGSEKATTRETTDSRGNRKIEVIIGDMVASEVSRVGSPVQQSISSNFNNKPALVRR